MLKPRLRSCCKTSVENNGRIAAAAGATGGARSILAGWAQFWLLCESQCLYTERYRTTQAASCGNWMTRISPAIQARFAKTLYISLIVDFIVKGNLRKDTGRAAIYLLVSGIPMTCPRQSLCHACLRHKAYAELPFEPSLSSFIEHPTVRMMPQQCISARGRFLARYDTAAWQASNAVTASHLAEGLIKCYFLLHTVLQFRPGPFGIVFELESNHDVVGVTHHDDIAVRPLLTPCLKPRYRRRNGGRDSPIEAMRFRPAASLLPPMFAYSILLAVVSAPARLARLPGAESGTRFVGPDSPWPDPFPHLLRHFLPSFVRDFSILRVCPNSRARLSSAQVLGLPDASRKHWLLAGEPRTSQLPCKVCPYVPGAKTAQDSNEACE